MTEVNTDEKVVATKTNTSFNVANVIAAIALLILVLGILKFMGALPF